MIKSVPEVTVEIGMIERKYNKLRGYRNKSNEIFGSARVFKLEVRVPVF